MNQYSYRQPFYRSVLALSLGLIIWLSSLTPVLAVNRRFLPISADFLDSYTLPKQLNGQLIGGLSALDYDRRQNQFYALSDDRNNPHIIQFNLDLTDRTSNSNSPNETPNGTPQIAGVSRVEELSLTDANGNPQPPGSLDPEGLALTPGSIYISSEGDIGQGIAPALVEFDRQTGQERRRLPIAPHYLPPDQPESIDSAKPADPTAALMAASRRGIQPNLGFESLSTVLAAPGEPVRLFTATEAPLLQDLPDRSSTPSNPKSESPGPWRNRLAHYSLLGDSQPLLIAEHLYPLDRRPHSLMIGLSDILALDNAGHFLAIERALAPTGFQVKLYQIAIAGASDISGYDLLQGPLRNVVPIAKQLLLDLNQLPVRLDNLEGLALGPTLADGSQSLVLIADDNFNRIQRNQILLFRLGRAPKGTGA